MFRRPSKRALYERLLDEKDRQIDRLEAEVLVLRTLDHAPIRFPLPDPPARLADGSPAVVDDGGWMSEAEEAQKIIEANGLSAVHLPEILSGLGYGDSEL